MISKIDFWYNRTFGYYHWYSVRYVYRINGDRVFDMVTEIGLKDRRDILNRRTVKLIQKNMHKNKSIHRLLNNGKLDVEILCYIGRLKKRL